MTAEREPRRADHIRIGDLIASKNATWTRVEEIEPLPQTYGITLYRFYGPMGVHIRTVKGDKLLRWRHEDDC